MPTHALKRALAAATVTTVSAGLLAVTTGTALAGTTSYPAPPYTDPAAIGTLTFYDAAGHVVTGGNTADPISSYVIGSATAPGSTATKGTLFGYLPKNGQAPGAFSGEALAGPTTFPIASAPSPVKDYPYPAVAVAATDLTLANLVQDFPNTAPSGDAYEGLYVLRVKTSDAKYSASTVQITGSTWHQVNPNFTTTTTALTVTDLTDGTAPAGTATTGDSLKLAAAVAGTGAAGKVAFLDGSTVLSTVDLASGAASYTISSVAKGSHSYAAVYYPAPGSNTFDSSAAAQAYDVQDPKPASYTAVSTNATATTTDQDDVTVTATVTTPGASGSPVTGGSVAFSDSIDGSLGSVPVTASGVAAVTRKFSAAYGSSAGHVVTATYSNTGTYKPSSATAPAFQVQQSGPCAQAGSSCTDPQVFKVTVATGTLTITTPYLDQSTAFNLGTMVLADNGTYLSSSAPFGSATDGKGVTITDRRAGDLPWDAKVSAQDFASAAGDKINAQNLSFTAVKPGYLANNALNATSKPVVTNDLPTTTTTGYAAGDTGSDGLRGLAKRFAHADKGNGTVYVYGTMNLVAPTSTKAGTYYSTVTFTVG